MRRSAAVVALAVTLIACSATTPASDPGSDYGDGARPTTAAERSKARARQKESRAAAQPNPVPGYTGQPRYGGDPGNVPVAYNDRGPVGGAAASYLRASPARRMILEIDYIEGRRPSDGAVRHVESILRRELSKPGGISIRIDDAIDDVRDEWSLSDLRELENRYRDNASAGSVVTMWIPYVSGELQDEAGALGVAYQATTAALFPDRIRSAATTLVQPDAIERAVLTHEVGHLLGLVNIVIRSRHDHEDPEHPGHSKYTESVMYWAIEDVSIASLLSGGPPSDFDRYDRDDLAAIKRG